jgi:hypothetical protein
MRGSTFALCRGHGGISPAAGGRKEVFDWSFAVEANDVLPDGTDNELREQPGGSSSRDPADEQWMSPREQERRQTRRLDRATFAALTAELMAEGDGLRFRAHGRSMKPFIRDGDVLVIARIAPAELRTGDVALFRSRGGSVLAHRVCRSVGRGEKTRWTTRGDALFMLDSSFGPDRLLGRVVTVERGGRIRRMDAGFGRSAGLLWLLTYHPRFLLTRVATRLRAALMR